MLTAPKKRELPLVHASEDPPKLKSIEPLAETLMGRLKLSDLPTKWSLISIGVIAEVFSRLIGISTSMFMIVSESIRPFFSNKDMSLKNIFRALMYVVANADELKKGNIVPTLMSGIPINTSLWQLIKIVDVQHIATTEKGKFYSVECIVLSAPLAGSTFKCRISGKQIKRLIRDNSSCKFSPHVIPEFIFGYKLMALLVYSAKGIAIQKTSPVSSCVSYNVKIKKARLDCKKHIPCTSCHMGVDKCRYATKIKSWKLVVCPFCLKDTYLSGKTTTCMCYKENYYVRE